MKDSDVEFKKYKEQDEDRLYDTVADGEDYPDDKPEREIMDVTPKQATAQQKTGHPSLKTEPGGQEIKLRRETMSYAADLYLDYLDEKETYQEIYEDLAYQVFVEKTLTPDMLKSLIQKQQSYINQLAQQKARFADNPQVVAAIDAKLKTAGASLGKLQQKMTDMPVAAKQPADIPAPPTAEPIKPLPDIPKPPTDQPIQKTADIPKPPTDKPVDPAAIPEPGGRATGLKGGEKTPAPAPEPTTVAKPDLGTPADYGVVGSTPPKVIPQDPSLAQQAGQAVSTAAGKAKELGGDILAKGTELGTQAGQAATSGLTKAGVDPTVAGGVGSAIQAVGASPLGLAALGGAAAFGGYKLYKRFLSKSATACKGYSGPDKTACMKSYMNAKKNQAATRGAEAAGG